MYGLYNAVLTVKILLSAAVGISKKSSLYNQCTVYPFIIINLL